MGGLVILASGANPIDAYLGILEGAGINWFWDHLGNTDVLDLSTFNLTQTLLRTTTFALTGLAVAFAFRCGLFNIGGQGQYTMGVVVGVWVGAYWGDALPSGLHVVVGIVLAGLAGALWAGIAGILKATVGAHEVITTIMLNWIAFWFASYCFGQGGPLQNRTPGQESVPISDSVYDNGVFIPILWGDEGLQALHYGIFLAVASLDRVLHRHQPDDARLRGPGGRFQPRRGRVRRDQREEELLPRDGDLRPVRRASPRQWTSSGGSTRRACSTSRPRRWASSGSPSRSSADRPRSASDSRRSSSARSTTGRRAASIPRCSTRPSPAT